MVNIALFLFLSFVVVIPSDARDLIIPDAACFERYAGELVKASERLSTESAAEYDSQLTAIESALRIRKPEYGYVSPLAAPICALADPPSNYTLSQYTALNKLHLDGVRRQLVNNRVYHRLMMIQKKILSRRRKIL